MGWKWGCGGSFPFFTPSLPVVSRAGISGSKWRIQGWGEAHPVHFWGWEYFPQSPLTALLKPHSKGGKPAKNDPPKITEIVRSAEFSVPAERALQNPDHQPLNMLLDPASPWRLVHSIPRKKKRAFLFPGKTETLKRSRGKGADPRLSSPAVPHLLCEKNQQWTEEQHVVQGSGRPLFATSANCCSPRKRAEGAIKGGGSREKKSARTGGTLPPLRSLAAEDYLVQGQLRPGFFASPRL